MGMCIIQLVGRSVWVDRKSNYENPGHQESGYLPGRQVPFNSSKSIIPPNAEELFKLSQLDPNDSKTTWVKIGEGKKAAWHRFQSSAADDSGPFH